MIGVGLAITAAVVIVTAMFAVDQGEEMLHLYQDFQTAQGNGGAAGGLSAIETGMEIHGHWRGMSLTDVTSPTAAALGAGNLEEGLMVAHLTPRGEAARLAGIQRGDVILGIDQKPVENLAGLQRAAQNVTPGAPVLVDVLRDGQPVTLVLPPEQPQALPAAFAGPQFYCPRDGVIVPGGGQGRACPRCNGPLHLYRPGRGRGRGAGPGYGMGGWGGGVPPQRWAR
jgi:S1-C subfamily serine protease